AGPHGLEHGGERAFVEEAPGDARQLRRVDDVAVAERIDERAPLPADPHQEMPRKADALDVDAEPATERHQDDRQGDGDPGATVEHLVEVAVARIVVIVGVALETELAVDVIEKD